MKNYLNLNEKKTVLHLLTLLCEATKAHSPEPHQIIDRPGSDVPYIKRWFLGRKIKVPAYVDSDHQIEGFIENLYVHEYGRSDNEDLHTHPWDNASLIVTGRYVEELADGKKITRMPGDIVLRRAEDAHRIIEVESGTTTLFGTLKKGRDWGFIVDGEFVHWQDYPLTAMHEPA